MFLQFASIFVGTVVAGGGKYNGTTYVQALREIDPSRPLGGGFACAIVATIVSFMALVLSLSAFFCFCPVVARSRSPPLRSHTTPNRTHQSPVADCCEKAAPEADTTDAALPK